MHTWSMHMSYLRFSTVLTSLKNRRNRHTRADRNTLWCMVNGNRKSHLLTSKMADVIYSHVILVYVIVVRTQFELTVYRCMENVQR